MSKVYLVETDNGEAYEDYFSSVVKAFTTYRAASEWLISEGYEPYYEMFHGEGRLRFYWEESDEYMSDCSFGKIIEMELEE
ncbi:hypothetical protein PQ478_08930 [Alkalihalophilus pseudofirmus]|uniref:hypothetical protein n=1 Tax=Alkalihalophilus pseudofirmus TaxID=79885 RepID=UPI00259B09D9|nr:hypothetical protein [Alkalihalophilus pseudofirmus]WEG18594.1 hypothetical protein PQ478_08930 [Alkalihalophilus pseudofirmus]